MPILKKDTDVNPPSLLDSRSLSFPSRRWFVLYTKPRQDKVLLRRLLSGGKSFCGLLVANRSRMPAGRMKTTWEPRFPGYVFLHGTQEARYDAVCTGCVQQVLDVFDGESLRCDLKRIHDAIVNGLQVQRAESIEKGQRVRVLAGPLRGHTGILLFRKGECRLVLSLSFIQQSAMVEIDSSLVEAA
jgi:transcriptional antiterminator RfaH